MNRYKVYWNGKLQPIEGITFDVAKKYILTCINSGLGQMWQFEIFDNYGQLKTNIIENDKADHTLLSNYFKLY